MDVHLQAFRDVWQAFIAKSLKRNRFATSTARMHTKQNIAIHGIRTARAKADKISKQKTHHHHHQQQQRLNYPEILENTKSAEVALKCFGSICRQN